MYVTWKTTIMDKAGKPLLIVILPNSLCTEFQRNQVFAVLPRLKNRYPVRLGQDSLILSNTLGTLSLSQTYSKIHKGLKFESLPILLNIQNEPNCTSIRREEWSI